MKQIFQNLILSKLIDHPIVADEVEFWMQVTEKASMDLANKEKKRKNIVKNLLIILSTDKKVKWCEYK